MIEFPLQIFYFSKYEVGSKNLFLPKFPDDDDLLSWGHILRTSAFEWYYFVIYSYVLKGFCSSIEII